MKSPYSEEKTKEICQDYISGLSLLHTSKKHGIQPNTVRNVLIRCGVERRSPRTNQYILVPYSNEMELSVCRDYNSGLTLTQTGDKHAIDHGTVFKILKRRGIQRRPLSITQRRYPLNQNAFSSNNGKLTAEQRYWIGFLMADGSIGKSISGTPSVSVGLGIKDYKHVEKFQRFLGTTKPIYIESNNRGYSGSSGIAHFYVNSYQLAEDLAANGVISRKSTREEIPAHLALDYDVWRGIVDGDGWLFEGKGRYPYRPFLGVTGSKVLCEQFSRLVHYETEDLFSLHRNKSIWRVDPSGYAALIMIYLLYGKAKIYLDRKMEIAQRIMKRGWKLKRD